MRPALVIVLSLVLAGCAAIQPPDATAVAELRNATGQLVGTATLTQVGSGVRVEVRVQGLPPGDKGLHIHEVGRCEPPQFTSAGGHFNPLGKRHGILSPQGPHAGDLPNIPVGGDGAGFLGTTTDAVSLLGGPTSLFDADGSALVVHMGPDDLRTDPTGGSGGRLACGVIVRR